LFFFFQRVGQHDAADFSVATGAQLPPYLLVIQKKKTKSYFLYSYDPMYTTVTVVK
jgi:hypothetical protein